MKGETKLIIFSALFMIVFMGGWLLFLMQMQNVEDRVYDRCNSLNGIEVFDIAQYYIGKKPEHYSLGLEPGRYCDLGNGTYINVGRGWKE